MAVTGPGRRALLGLLAASAGRVVTVERIVDGLWAAPPASAVKVVQTHVSQLRRVLEDTLGPKTFAAHHAKGVTLSLDEVVALAAATVATVPD